MSKKSTFGPCFFGFKEEWPSDWYEHWYVDLASTEKFVRACAYYDPEIGTLRPYDEHFVVTTRQLREYYSTRRRFYYLPTVAPEPRWPSLDEAVPDVVFPLGAMWGPGLFCSGVDYRMLGRLPSSYPGDARSYVPGTHDTRLVVQ